MSKGREGRENLFLAYAGCSALWMAGSSPDDLIKDNSGKLSGSRQNYADRDQDPGGQLPPTAWRLGGGWGIFPTPRSLRRNCDEDEAGGN